MPGDTKFIIAQHWSLDSNLRSKFWLTKPSLQKPRLLTAPNQTALLLYVIITICEDHERYTVKISPCTRSEMLLVKEHINRPLPGK